MGFFLWEREELATQQWIDTLNSYLYLCFQIFQVFQKTWNLTSQEKVPKPQVNSEWIFPYEWGLVYVSLWYISRWNITLYIFSLSGVFLPSLALLYPSLPLKSLFFCFILLFEICLVRGMWVFRRTFFSREGFLKTVVLFRVWFCLVLEICFLFSPQFGLFHIFLQGN